MEQRRKLTVCNCYQVEATRMDAGASPCWVWPPEMAAEILAAQERRREIFNVWTKKKTKGRKNLVLKQELP